MDDWRITNQIAYLKDKKLILLKYRKYSENWDHDHCEFCFEKFSESNDGINEGYSTLDKCYWICTECYNDFKDLFKWTIMENYKNI